VALSNMSCMLVLLDIQLSAAYAHVPKDRIIAIYATRTKKIATSGRVQNERSELGVATTSGNFYRVRVAYTALCDSDTSFYGNFSRVATRKFCNFARGHVQAKTLHLVASKRS
jgi:hypothetical protein